MKKVLFVIPTMRMGGAEKALVSLLKSLDPKHLEMTLLLFEAGGILQQDIPPYVRIIQVDSVTRAMILELRYYLGSLLKSGHFCAAWDRLRIKIGSRTKKDFFSWNIVKKHISTLEGHYDVAVGFLEGYTDYYVIDKVDADRKIGWIHTKVSGDGGTDWEKEYYLRFDQLVTISELCRKAFINRIPEAYKKICVIENIVLPSDILERANEDKDIKFKKDSWNIVTVGRLEHVKGIDLAVKACKIVRKRGYNIVWHVYGEGSLKKEYMKLVGEYGLEDCFMFEGAVSNPYPYMKYADIIVQPSRNEGKSVVLNEAKILGKAIVVTNYHSVYDQIIDKKTGLIADITPESIADNIIKLIDDLPLREKLERNSKKEKDQSLLSVDEFYKLINVPERGDSFGY